MTAEHPEGWRPETGIDRRDLARAFQRIDAEAAEHLTDYAAGMRLARHLVEEELKT